MDASLRRFADFDLGPNPPAPPLRAEEFAKILRLRPQDPPAQHRPATITPTEIAAALDLVRDAAASIREADDRVRDSETRTHGILQRAAEELKAAEARAEAAEARIRAAEARAREAESRAEEAENWLRQIFSAISEELPRR